MVSQFEAKINDGQVAEKKAKDKCEEEIWHMYYDQNQTLQQFQLNICSFRFIKTKNKNNNNTQ